MRVGNRRPIPEVHGKSAIHMARMYAGRKQNYVGQHFWARGYFA